MIEGGKKIKLHYTLKVEDQVVESSVEREPFEYVHGQDSIIPGLQKGLEGLKAGDHKEITVGPDDGFGVIDPEAFVEVPRSRLPQGNLSVGTVLTTSGPGGEVLRARITEIRDDSAILDFNHPLVGKELLFEVDILEIS